MVCKIDIFPVCLPQRKSVGTTSLLKGAKKLHPKNEHLFKRPFCSTPKPPKTPSPNLPQPLRPTNFSFSFTDSSKKTSFQQHPPSTWWSTVNRVNPSTSNRRKKVRGKILGQSQGNYNTPLEHIPTKNPRKKLWKESLYFIACW